MPHCWATSPGALGKPLRDIWPIYNQLGPLNEAICAANAKASSPRIIRGRSIATASLKKRDYNQLQPIPDASAANGIGGVLATAFETTERVRKEKALQVLTELLELEVEQRTRERDRIWKVSEDLLGVANFDGYFLSVNPAWSNLLGWTEDEIKSLHVNDLRHPDDAEAAIARADSSREGCKTCASKIVSVTAMARGDG